MDFDSWIWAQSVYSKDPEKHRALDPDQNGIACEQLTIVGFAPATWADSVPDNVTAATIIGVTDGDTIRVRLADGSVDRVRLLHIDTPETSGSIGQCGAHDAKDYLDWILGHAEDGIVYLESDKTDRDRYDRKLAYVWFTIAGDPNPYMANDAMVLAGWAQSETYGPDSKYKHELNQSEQFSVDHVTGVRLLCGTFGQPGDSAAPSDDQIKKAHNMQPNQGQLPPYPGLQGPAAVSDTVQQPQQQTVLEQPAVQQDPAEQCDPSYPDFCIPAYAVYGDLDCGDVSGKRFSVYPPDPHGFDRDQDGIGCES